MLNFDKTFSAKRFLTQRSLVNGVQNYSTSMVVRTYKGESIINYIEISQKREIFKQCYLGKMLP
jgi:hypothetical protein